MEPLLQVAGASCDIDGQAIVRDISLVVATGSSCCLLGPSGCGKTTLLRAIAGFQELTAGSISLAGETLAQVGRSMPPEQRQLGMVFQDYALFPHLTVAENIAFGLAGKSRQQQADITADMVQLVRLEQLERRYPHELSGGQRQRVALARAMARQPRLLLLDEPFSSLDSELRRSLCVEVRDILKQQQISAMLVTHDQDEAFAFGEQIGLMRNGSLEQWATPYDLYHRPNNRFAANFIGGGKLLRGTVLDKQRIETEIGIIGGQQQIGHHTGDQVDVLIRPDDLVLSEQGGTDALITAKTFSGSATFYTLQLPSGSELVMQQASHTKLTVGNPVTIVANLEHLISFAGEAT